MATTTASSPDQIAAALARLQTDSDEHTRLLNELLHSLRGASPGGTSTTSEVVPGLAVTRVESSGAQRASTPPASSEFGTSLSASGFVRQSTLRPSDAEVAALQADVKRLEDDLAAAKEQLETSAARAAALATDKEALWDQLENTEEQRSCLASEVAQLRARLAQQRERPTPDAESLEGDSISRCESHDWPANGDNSTRGTSPAPGSVVASPLNGASVGEATRFGFKLRYPNAEVYHVRGRTSTSRQRSTGRVSPGTPVGPKGRLPQRSATSPLMDTSQAKRAFRDPAASDSFAGSPK